MNNFKMIVSMPFGSTLYGTSTPNSDLDIKAVAFPSKESIIFGKIPKHLHSFKTSDGETKNSKNDIDLEIMHLYKFINDALDGQTYAFDMLHAPKEILFRSSVIWEDLVAYRDKFYSKNITAMYDYCRDQVAKYGLKGGRLNDAMVFAAFLKKQDQYLKLDAIWDELPDLDNSIKYVQLDTSYKIYEICGKKFLETARVRYVLDSIMAFEQKFGERAKQAQRNENIDYKCWHHCARVGSQILELLKDGTITMPRPNKDILLEIKLGQWKYDRFSVYLDDMFDEIKELRASSTLPDNPDKAFWTDWLYDAIYEYVLETK